MAFKTLISIQNMIFLLIVGLIGINISAQEILSCNDPKFDQKMAGDTGISSWFRPGRKKSPNRPGPVKNFSPVVSIHGQETAVNFELHQATVTPSKGTVVFFCGGPGIACTEEGRPKSVPANMDVIVTDYIGIGKNTKVKEVEQMSVESQADVALGIIKHLKLDNYVLYGSSFGTAVATIAAARLSNDPVQPKPKMVVLDGIVNRAQDRFNEAAIARASDRVWQLLSAEERKRFGAVYDEVTKNMNTDDRFELDAKLIGTLQAGPVRALEGLRIFINKKALHEQGEPGETEASNRQYRAAGCQQLPPRQAPGPNRYLGGKVQNTRIAVDPPGVQIPCDCPLITRLYNSQQYQIKQLPILYINSETDVITPIENARLHMGAQNNTNQKFLLSVRDGTHGDLEELAKCSAVVWDAAMKGSLPTIQARSGEIRSDACDDTAKKKGEEQGLPPSDGRGI